MNIGILAYRGVMRSAVYGIEEMLHIAGERYGVAIDGVVRVAPEALVGRFFGGATAVALGKYFLLDAASRRQSHFSCFIPILDHKDGLVLTVQHKLEKHFSAPLTVTEMAAWVHISPRTLQRRFQTATGVSPIRYLQKLRLSKAQEKLESSRQSLEEIAAAVGYEDISSFRQLFRRQFGLSPSKYRQRFSFLQKKGTADGDP